jgi:hypothetical protein
MKLYKQIRQLFVKDRALVIPSVLLRTGLTLSLSKGKGAAPA